MMNWLDIKDEAALLLVEKDALHIYAAVAVQVGTARLSRRTLGNGLPWLVVLLFELVNEALDVLLGQESVLRQWQVVGGVHDAVNTMLMPTVLLILSRRSPGLFARTVEAPASHATPAGAGALNADREATPGT